MVPVGVSVGVIVSCMHDIFVIQARRRAYSVTFYRQRAVVVVARQGASVFLRNTFLVLYFGMDFSQIIKLYDDGRAHILQIWPYHTISVISVQFKKLLLHGNLRVSGFNVRPTTSHTETGPRFKV